MEKIFTEENKFYQIDFSKALWATDEINDLYHKAKVELSDVDFVAETDKEFPLTLIKE